MSSMVPSESEASLWQTIARLHRQYGEGENVMTGVDYRHGKSNTANTITYRMMTTDEAKSLNASHAPFRDNEGNVRTVKINGRVRTWKRNASRVEVPCKYGLYEYFTDVPDGDGDMHWLVVVSE